MEYLTVLANEFRIATIIIFTWFVRIVLIITWYVIIFGSEMVQLI